LLVNSGDRLADAVSKINRLHSALPTRNGFKNAYTALTCQCPGAFFRGVTCAVPPLEIETEIERRLFEAGKMRKEMRHEIMARNRKLHVGVPD
jgi:hypothetical protein